MKSIIRNTLIVLMLAPLGGCVYPYDGYGGNYYVPSNQYYYPRTSYYYSPRYVSPYYYPNYTSSRYYGSYPSTNLNIGISSSSYRGDYGGGGYQQRSYGSGELYGSSSGGKGFKQRGFGGGALHSNSGDGSFRQGGGHGSHGVGYNR